MTTDRPYRRASPVEQALDELRSRRGSRQFDPRVVDAFLAAYPFSVPRPRAGGAAGAALGRLRRAGGARRAQLIGASGAVASGPTVAAHDSLVGRLVRRDELLAAEAALHGAAAIGRVDLAHVTHGFDHLVDGVDDEPGAAVLQHLGHRAVAEGHHRGPRGERLDHDEAERLGPLDGEQRAARLGVEARLGLVIHFAAEVDALREVRLDLRGEVGLLRRLVDLARQNEARLQPPRHFDGRVGALVGDHAADEQEVILLVGAERQVLHVDGVGDGRDEAQVGEAAALVVRDGDERQVVAQGGQQALRGGVGGAVQGGHHGRAQDAPAPGRPWRRPGKPSWSWITSNSPARL